MRPTIGPRAKRRTGVAAIGEPLMVIESPPAWVRHRAIFSMSAPWHLLQAVTPAGIRVTSCGEILTPDEDVEARAADEADGERCSMCTEHHDGAA